MIEVAVLCVLLALVMKLVAAVNRVNSGRSAVEQAAWAAARAASLDATPAQAQRDAEQTAEATLTRAGRSCVDPLVAMDASAFYPGGQVTVTVTCYTDLATLTVSGMPGSVHLSARGTAPLEVHRDLPQPDGGIA